MRVIHIAYLATMIKHEVHINMDCDDGKCPCLGKVFFEYQHAPSRSMFSKSNLEIGRSPKITNKKVIIFMCLCARVENKCNPCYLLPVTNQ